MTLKIIIKTKVFLPQAYGDLSWFWWSCL